MSGRHRRPRRRGGRSVVLAGTTAVVAGIVAAPVAAAAPGGGCPAVQVLGVAGTGETTPDADPRIETGMLAGLLGPLHAAAGVATRMVPYEASFGGAPGTGGRTAPFEASVRDGVARLDAAAAEVVGRCPGTQVAVAGYSQGAQVAGEWSALVGAGRARTPAARVAGVALYSDPTHPSGEVVAGRPGQRRPDAAPGTGGANVARVRLPAPSAGAGMAAPADYRTLTGRVASLCAPGDLACDAPPAAAGLRAVAGIAARSDLRDPVAALGSLAANTRRVVEDTAARVVLRDIHIDAGRVDYAPAATMSDRAAEAADPRTAAAPVDVRRAAERKWERVVGAVVADPIGTLPRLAGQLGAAVGAELAANRDLLSPPAWAGFGDAVGRHVSYGTPPAPGAAPPLAAAADWFAAAARDLMGGGAR